MDPVPLPAANADDDYPAPDRARFSGLGVPDEPHGPLIAALLLSWISAPFAALSVIASSRPISTNAGDPVTLTFLPALAIAFTAVTAAALVGGMAGGALVRKRPVLGLATALFVAWPIGIATLPVLPSVLGWPFRAAINCIASCNPMISGDAPFSGISAYVATLVFGLVGNVEVAGILALIAIVLARSRYRLLSTAFVIATFVSANFWSVFWDVSEAPPIAAIALVVGSIIWVTPYWTGTADDGPRATHG